MENIKHILWSGGWDSTFMLCKMAREQNISIQPHYMILKDSKITFIELKRMYIIRKLLKEKTDIKAEILKPIVHKAQSYNEIDEKILKSFSNLIRQYRLGAQYLYFTYIANKFPGIALGQENYYRKPGKMNIIIREKGNIQFSEDGVGYLPKNIDSDIYCILGNYTFPIFQLSEMQMLEMVKEWGYEDIMKYIWFCYEPLDNQPCGICYTCCGKMSANMFNLFPDKALLRYMIYKELEQKDKKLSKDFVDYFLHNKITKNKNIFKNLLKQEFSREIIIQRIKKCLDSNIK